MVLDDIFSEHSNTSALNQDADQDSKKSDPKHSTWREDMLASPRDRLAATAADMIVFLPVIALIIAPLRKVAQNAKVLGHEDQWIFAMLGLGFLAMCAVIAYQTLFLVFFGGTPGKLALRLRVVSVHSERALSASEAFWRSFVWCLELLCLGVPWLSLFSNERRRPLHDRIAETAVVALSKNRRAGLATLPEMSVASGFQSAVLASILLLVVTNFNHWRKEYESDASAIARQEVEGLFCPEVREAIESERGTKKASAIADRLDVALSLYTLGEIDESCLDAESDFALIRGEQKATAYLAKGLTTTDEEKVDAYFAKACEGNEGSDACRMTLLSSVESAPAESAEERAFEVTRENQISEIGDLLHVTGPSSISRYLRVAVIDYWMDHHEYAKALQAMDSPQVFPGRIGARLSLERAKALWELDRKSEARLTMKSANDLLDNDSRLNMARWFCFNETFANGCSAEARISCDRLSASVDDFSAYLMKPEVASAFIRAESCRMSENGGGTEQEWSELAKKLPTKEAKSYVEALSKAGTKEGLAAFQLLSRAGSSIFALESLVQLIEHSKNEGELAKLEEAWKDASPSDEAWKLVGQRLASRAADFRAWDKAVKIGLRMIETDPHDRAIYRGLIVAAFEAGHEKMALGLLDSFKRLDREFEPLSVSVGGRIPASSTNNFERIVEELEAKAATP